MSWSNVAGRWPASTARTTSIGTLPRRRTVVPVYGNHDLKPGTQRGIMRDAGLTDDDL